MPTAIRMNDRPVIAIGYLLDSSVQHGVYKLGIRTRSDSPADNQAIEAVDDGREVHLASGDLELCDVREPLLIRDSRLEVAVDEIVRCGGDFSQV